MPKYMAKVNRKNNFKATTRTVDAENPDVAIEMILAETDDKGEKVLTNVIEVWERVRWTETKREMKSNG